MIKLQEVSSLLTFVTQACFFAEKFDPIIITSVPFYDIIAGISSAAIYIAVVQTFCMI